MTACLGLAAFTTATAQSRPKTTKPAAQTPLRFRSTWNIYLSDSVPRPDILKILDSPLVVRDQKNNKYPVTSFEFTYEKREAGINDTTQKPVIYSDFTGDIFKADRLSPLWTKNLKENLQPGDVLYFNNIVVKRDTSFYRVSPLKFFVR